jgi:hypothetical protein
MATGPFDDVPFRHLVQPLSRLTEHEQTTVEAYTLNNYARVNAALRGNRPMTSDLAESIATMRSAINKFPLDKDIRATREISATEFFGMQSAAEAARRTPGQLFTEAGFLSASMNESPPRSTTRIQPLDQPTHRRRPRLETRPALGSTGDRTAAPCLTQRPASPNLTVRARPLRRRRSRTSYYLNPRSDASLGCAVMLTPGYGRQTARTSSHRTGDG